MVRPQAARRAAHGAAVQQRPRRVASSMAAVLLAAMRGKVRSEFET